jgi:hypothetical protein
MSVGATGALLGLMAALASCLFLRALSGRVDLPETKQALKVSGAVQLVVLPVMGWFAGSFIAGD